MRTIVIDTNVLLANPSSLFDFPDTEIIIPETVLGELDKLKTSRADADLRFRGREISRILFELSEQGSLINGVELPDGSRMRVVPFDSDVTLPDGMTSRNADDRILAVAFQVCQGECEGGLTVVTNDLNMLLKAQTLGLDVERHGEGPDGNFAKRYIIRPFQRYRIPLTILGISVAVFAAIVVLIVYGPGSAGTSSSSGLPTEFREQLSASDQKILDYLNTLERNEADLDTRLALANTYYELRLETGDIRYSQLAIRHYERYLEIKPDNTDIQADLSASYFYAGQTDRAIQEAGSVIALEPNHLQANFNLGIFYWQGRRDFAAAATQFNKVIELTNDDSSDTAHAINQQAIARLADVYTDAEAAGQPLDPGGTF